MRQVAGYLIIALVVGYLLRLAWGVYGPRLLRRPSRRIVIDKADLYKRNHDEGPDNPTP